MTRQELEVAAGGLTPTKSASVFQLENLVEIRYGRERRKRVARKIYIKKDGTVVQTVEKEFFPIHLCKLVTNK